MDLCASEVPNTAHNGGVGHDSAAPGEVSVSIDLPRIALEANQTYTDYPRQKCLHELLGETAQQHRQETAVEFAGKSLTYGELDARSNQLARFLQRKGVGPESLVGLCVERSLEMVVALLGILKAGGAYVPLDPDYPADRIKYVLDDSRVKLLLTQDSLRASLPETSAEIVTVEADWSAFQNEPTTSVASGAKPENLAYVIYTSGSTGR